MKWRELQEVSATFDAPILLGKKKISSSELGKVTPIMSYNV